ncbi:MAG: flagellar hook-length control protein FliK [Pontibacterium sp.]
MSQVAPATSSVLLDLAPTTPAGVSSLTPLNSTGLASPNGPLPVANFAELVKQQAELAANGQGNVERDVSGNSLPPNAAALSEAATHTEGIDAEAALNMDALQGELDPDALVAMAPTGELANPTVLPEVEVQNDLLAGLDARSLNGEAHVAAGQTETANQALVAQSAEGKPLLEPLAESRAQITQAANAAESTAQAPFGQWLAASQAQSLSASQTKHFDVLSPDGLPQGTASANQGTHAMASQPQAQSADQALLSMAGLTPTNEQTSLNALRGAASASSLGASMGALQAQVAGSTAIEAAAINGASVNAASQITALNSTGAAQNTALTAQVQQLVAAVSGMATEGGDGMADSLNAQGSLAALNSTQGNRESLGQSGASRSSGLIDMSMWANADESGEVSLDELGFNRSTVQNITSMMSSFMNGGTANLAQLKESLNTVLSATQASLASGAVASSDIAQAVDDALAGVAEGDATEWVESLNRMTHPVQLSMAGKGVLGSAAWGQAFAEKLAVMSNVQGNHSLELQLDPPELGALKVKINVSAEQQVSLTFTSPHAGVRDVVEAQLPRLREMLEAQGLNLADTDFSDGGSEQDGQQQERYAGGGQSAEEGERTLEVSTPQGLVDDYA